VLLLVTGLILHLYSMPAEILWCYVIVVAYTAAFTTNCCFYLGARWSWITRMYWLIDLIVGLLIFLPLFLISIFRICDSVHMRLLYSTTVLQVLERAKLQPKDEDQPLHFKQRRRSIDRGSRNSSRSSSGLNTPLISEEMQRDVTHSPPSERTVTTTRRGQATGLQ
jgi:hypothetical protein